MAALQAFVDDSSSDVGDRQFFLAGYVNAPDRWAAFSKDWGRELARHPRIDYFKMVEANSLRGQFQGWSRADRDAKVLSLAGIINAHRPWFVFCSVSRDEYARILAPIAPAGLKNPYFACFWGVIRSTVRYHQMLENEFGGRDVPPVDFIFDNQQGLGNDAVLWYRWLKEGQDPSIRKFLGSKPIFCDDKAVLPLQAADMLAWHVRRDHETGGIEDRTVFNLLTEHGVGTVIDRNVLAGIAKQMKRVPGRKQIQTRSDWHKIRHWAREHIAAGGKPPTTNIWKMRYFAWRAWIERTVNRWLYPRR